MLYAIHCLDQPHAPALRKTHFEAHQAFLKASPLRIVVAGPLQDDAGAAAVGSLLIVEAASRAEVEAFNAADPYFKAGVWSRIDITRFNKRWDDRDEP